MELRDRGLKSCSGQFSITTSTTPTVVNTISTNSLSYNLITCERLSFQQIRQLTKAKTEMKHELWTKRWSWNSCTKLALKAGLNSWLDSSVGYSVWTESSEHGFKSCSGTLFIATSRNPMVVNTIRINSFCYSVITTERLPLRKMWRLLEARIEIKREDWTKR